MFLCSFVELNWTNCGPVAILLLSLGFAAMAQKRYNVVQSKIREIEKLQERIATLFYCSPYFKNDAGESQISSDYPNFVRERQTEARATYNQLRVSLKTRNKYQQALKEMLKELATKIGIINAENGVQRKNAEADKDTGRQGDDLEENIMSLLELILDYQVLDQETILIGIRKCYKGLPIKGEMDQAVRRWNEKNSSAKPQGSEHPKSNGN
jgi:hypothetical protein